MDKYLTYHLLYEQYCQLRPFYFVNQFPATGIVSHPVINSTTYRFHYPLVGVGGFHYLKDATIFQMALKFIVSAPGKVILFGEHAAVYGKPAIAAAISLRSYLLVTTLSESRIVKLNFNDIGLNHEWNTDTLPWHLVHLPPKGRLSFVNSLDPALLEAITPHAEAVSKGLPEEQRKIHVRSAKAFLCLFLSLGSPDNTGYCYTLRSTVPIGAGLGRSASVCVCLSAALLLQMQVIPQPYSGQPPEQAKEHAELISNWAFMGELCMHEGPSGVDNAVSARGKAVAFYRMSSSSPIIAPLTTVPRLPLLLVDTQQPRSTATQVKKVKDNLSVETVSIIEQIGKLTGSALELISSADFGENGDSDAFERLGILIRENQKLLVLLGVSHVRLERITELVDGAGIGWTKLTGAGGGGCAIVLLRPDIDDDTVKELELQFAAEGYRLYKTAIGADGVGVFWPGIEGDDSEEIDQERVENALGVQGIEELMEAGVHGRQEAWRFWSTYARI